MDGLSPVTRPVVRWFGGKWLLAPWIIQHFPAHRVYVEPFGGGGSVLLRKPRAYAEVYNDLDSEVVNLFRVLRDGAQAAQLIEQLRLTPFARAEWEASYEQTEEAVERARRLCVRSFMGYGANGHNVAASTGFRGSSNHTGRATVAVEWRGYPPALAEAVERLRGVVIETRDAVTVMDRHDGPHTLHYVDPPYIWGTRGRFSAQRRYVHELTHDQHVELLAFLRGLKGMVVLSGYPHALYDTSLVGWQRIERPALADGARERTEVLWINEACISVLEERRLL
jgi:DNA adenine methylase